MRRRSANGSSRYQTSFSQQLPRVGPDDELVVLGAELLGDDARVVELVEARPREADGEGLGAGAPSSAISADDDARVDAAGEEGADRDVGDEVRLDGVVEHVRERTSARPRARRRRA